MLNIMDEFTRECLAIKIKRRINSFDVLETLADLFLLHGEPKFIRSDNGPEFITERLRDWLSGLEVKTLFIEPGTPWAGRPRQMVILNLLTEDSEMSF